MRHTAASAIEPPNRAKRVRSIVTPSCQTQGARSSSVVRAFAHGAMGHWIDPSWCGPIELFLVPACALRLVLTKAVVSVILSVG